MRWVKFRIWRLRRKEKKYEEAVSYYYERRRNAAMEAYETDQFHQPRRWGEAQSNANWYGYMLNFFRDELRKVRAKLKELENALGP